MSSLTFSGPYIWVGENQGEYDEGGNEWRMSQRGGPPLSDKEPHDTSRIEPRALDVMKGLVNNPWGLTLDQLFWIANLSPQHLGGDAEIVYRALKTLNLQGFVPLDNWRMVKQGRHLQGG